MRARRGKLTEAADDLHRAIRIEPEHHQAYSNLARVFSVQGRSREAIEQTLGNGDAGSIRYKSRP